MVTKNGKRKPKLLTDMGEIAKGPSVVVCPAPMREGVPMKDAVTGKTAFPTWVWNVSTWRKDTGEWRVDLLWWDSNETGHVVHLPDGVCKTIFRHQREIIQEAKKVRGQKAYQTAVMNARAREIEPGNEA